MTASEVTALHPRIRELVDFLEMHRRAVLDAVASVPSALRGRKPSPEGWSVAEVIEHLTMIEQRVATVMNSQVTAAREKGVGPDTETSSVVASFANTDRILDRTSKIAAPTPVIPTGAVDSDAGLRALDQAHAAMVSSLHNANGVSLEGLMQTHRIFGPLNLYHFVVALGLHDARHAAQIREIGQSLGAS